MVGRLVEEQQVVGRDHHLRQRETHALATGQHTDAALCEIAGEAEGSQERTLIDAAVALAECGTELLQRAALGVERVGRMLVDEGRAHVRAWPHLARGRRRRTRKDAQDRRLPGPVRTDQRDLTPALDREVDTAEHLVVVVAHADTDELSDDAPGPFGLGEPEARDERAMLGHLDASDLVERALA